MIARIAPLAPVLKTHELSEFSVILDYERIPGAGKLNPYDDSELAVEAVLRAPDGRETVHPAFFARHQDSPAGGFLFRFNFDVPGEWTLTARSRPSASGWTSLTFAVREAPRRDRGLIDVDRENGRYFIDGDGKTFIPVGCNLAWGRDTDLADYGRWLSRLRENGMNIARVWLAPWSFALHVDSCRDFSAAEPRLSRLDRLIEAARAKGVYIILTLLNHGQFSRTVNPTWDKNPYNYLPAPADFFTDAGARRAYFNELRYIVARYGYASNLFAWELFNEIDHVEDYAAREQEITAWLENAAAYLKFVDNYRHLVTTSYYTEYGPAFNLPAIDFVSAHSYEYAGRDIYKDAPAKVADVYAQYRKPVLYAEFGVSYRSASDTYAIDPRGDAITAGLWAAILGGGAGGAMPWWWDNYIERYNLFPRFKGAGIIAPALDFRGPVAPLKASVSDESLRVFGLRFPGRVYACLSGDFPEFGIDARVIIPGAESIDNFKIYDAASGLSFNAYDLYYREDEAVIDLASVRAPLCIIGTRR